MTAVSPVTLDEMRARVRKWTRTNATNYTDADINRDLNLSLGEVWMTILEAEGYRNTGGDFKVQDNLSTVGLVPDPNTGICPLGYNGEYPFPSLALMIDRAEISYDGLNWYAAEIIDKSNTLSSFFNETDYNLEFSVLRPKIFVYRDSYFIRPTIDIAGDITDGIKLAIIARQDLLSVDSDFPSFEMNFHNLVPLKTAQDFSMQYPEKRNAYVDQKIQILEAQLISYYQSRTLIEPRIQALPQERGLRHW